MSWKKMPDGKEKYAAYLCSREWSVLKEAVKGRSGGVCERCKEHQMDHVHHLTYERKYAERLEDLQACCRHCHEFIHAKSDYDPAENRPIVVPWGGESVKSFYLAGKISGTTWRDAIVAGWSYENHSRAHFNAFIDYDECKTWATVPNASIACGVNLHYAGPWWRDTTSLGCGHARSDSSTHPHGYFLDFQPDHDLEVSSARAEVSRAVQFAIKAADLVFAWIDGPDCYGTILEIGYARAIGKAVVIAMSDEFATTMEAHEMWLATKWGYYIEAKSPGEAWSHFWEMVAAEQEATSVAQAG